MLTFDQALNHLGYDEIDERIAAIIRDELAGAEAYLKGAVGEDILDLMPDDPRVNILMKAYLDDQHDDRGTTSAKAGNATRAMIHSTEWQLKLELARRREEAASV